MIRIAVCGGFDPYPHKGHRNHIKEAAKLGDYLIAMVNPDEDMVRKKGVCLTPYEERAGIVADMWCVDEVVKVIDKDGTCAETLKKIRPNIYAKGGDRTENNMPKKEIEICKELGIEIRYGVGGQLKQSRNIAKDLKEKLSKLRRDYR